MNTMSSNTEGIHTHCCPVTLGFFFFFFGLFNKISSVRMNDTFCIFFLSEFLCCCFFFFFYSTSVFRIHIICLKVFTYKHHGEHQGLWWKIWTIFVFSTWYNLRAKLMHLMIHTIKDALCTKPKKQMKSLKKKKTFLDMTPH